MSLKKIESTPISIEELRRRLPKYCNAVLYKTLQKDKRHRSKIFADTNALVVLYEAEIDGQVQGHFVVLIPRKTHIEYFSSLGKSPNHETTILGLENNVFKRLLGSNYKYSRAKLQRDTYTINTCGRWVLARCYLVDWNLQRFQSFFQKRQQVNTPDDKVTLMTMILQ